MIPTVIRNNATDIIMFRTKSKQELQTIYDNVIDLDEDKWVEFYEYATAEKHKFLYAKLNKNPQLYYKCFMEQLL